MPTEMKKWISQAKMKIKGKSLEEMSSVWFMRDPLRVMPACRDFFYTPADGFISIQGRFDAADDLIDIKGAEISVNTLLGSANEIEGPCLVTAVFMSFLDVHVNRAPTECILSRYPQTPLRTQNRPMLWTEKEILEDLKIKPKGMEFMCDNERVVNKLYVPYMRYTYYVVRIADTDVNSIVPMKATPVFWYNQNERFGRIIWGSMCVLVLPIDKRFKFKPLCRIGDHVECCIDPLVKVDLY